MCLSISGASRAVPRDTVSVELTYPLSWRAGIDVVTISRRLGHSNPQITLTTYAFLLSRTDAVAADKIEAMLTRREI